MAGMELQLSNLIVITALVLVVVGLVFAIFWFFKRAENLTDEDRLHIERAKVAFIGSVAFAVLAMVSMKKEKTMKLSFGGKRSSASLL